MIVYKIKFYVNNTSHLTHKCFFVHFEFRSDPELDPDPIFFAAEPDPDLRKNVSDPNPWLNPNLCN